MNRSVNKNTTRHLMSFRAVAHPSHNGPHRDILGVLRRRTSLERNSLARPQKIVSLRTDDQKPIYDDHGMEKDDVEWDPEPDKDPYSDPDEP